MRKVKDYKFLDLLIKDSYHIKRKVYIIGSKGLPHVYCKKLLMETGFQEKVARQVVLKIVTLVLLSAYSIWKARGAELTARRNRV